LAPGKADRGRFHLSIDQTSGDYPLLGRSADELQRSGLAQTDQHQEARNKPRRPDQGRRGLREKTADACHDAATANSIHYTPIVQRG